MTAYTRDEFMAAAYNAMGAYPSVAASVKAGDPRVLAHLAANATMLSMLSSQVEVAKYEAFLKSRDGTVLADASLKGILPLARAARVTLTLTNSDHEELTLGAQRRINDAKGRQYELDSDVIVPAGGTATVTALQVRRRSVTSKVERASDFYEIPLNMSADDLSLNTLTVFLGTKEFTYAPEWFNVEADAFAYQVEVDELRQMWVKFGKSSVIGYGVKQGDEFTLEITECNGRISDLSEGSQFTLEYIFRAGETNLKMVLASVDDEGAAPSTIDELRVMARYPAIYDHNAVYLGEFAFLLRRYLSGVRFLSVWNEQIEEKVRGASEDNINTLFVSGLVTGMDNAAFEARVSTLIKRADDSYRIRFVPTALAAVPVTITASVAISWDLATVEAQIRALILDYYADGKANVSIGMEQPIRKALIHKLLRENVDALRDDRAEYDVQITLPSTALPEHFLHVSAASLTVNVSSNEYGQSLWNN